MTETRDRRHLLTEFTPSRRTVLEWTVLGSSGVLVAAFVFAALYAVATGQPTLEFETGRFGSVLVVGLVSLLLVGSVIVLHEGVHAAVIRYYGGDVSFGVGVAQFVVPYAYVTTTRRLTRNQFLVVALAPLVVVSAVGVPVLIALEAPILVVPLAFNAGGAIGDLWIAGILLRYPRHVVVEDSVTGLRIYGRDADRPLPATPTRTFLRRTALGTGVAFALIVLAAMIAPMLSSALGVSSFAIGQPGSPWSLFHFEGTPGEGFESGLNPVGAFAVSLLVGFSSALLTTLRRPAHPERSS